MVPLFLLSAALLVGTAVCGETTLAIQILHNCKFGVSSVYTQLMDEDIFRFLDKESDKCSGLKCTLMTLKTNDGILLPSEPDFYLKTSLTCDGQKEDVRCAWLYPYMDIRNSARNYLIDFKRNQYVVEGLGGYIPLNDCSTVPPMVERRKLSPV